MGDTLQPQGRKGTSRAGAGGGSDNWVHKHCGLTNRRNLELPRALHRDAKENILPPIRTNCFCSPPQNISSHASLGGSPSHLSLHTCVRLSREGSARFHVEHAAASPAPGSAGQRPPAAARGIIGQWEPPKGIFHLLSQREMSHSITQISDATKQCIHFYPKEIAMFIWTCLLSLRKK